MWEKHQSSDCKLVHDWVTLDGAEAEIVRQGRTVARGKVDGVTDDGSIIWIRDNIGYRRLYEKYELYQVWISGKT